MTTPTTKIAKVLEESGRSRAWLGKKLGVSRQTVAAWFRGEEACPTSRQAQIYLFLEITPPRGFFDRDGFAIVDQEAPKCSTHRD